MNLRPVRKLLNFCWDEIDFFDYAFIVTNDSAVNVETRQQLVHWPLWHKVLHSNLLSLNWTLATEHSMQQWFQMSPEPYTKKCIKDRIEAAVGESKEPAYVKCIIKLGAFLTAIKWFNQMSRQNLQKDHHIVRHPVDEEHSHNTEDQLDCSVLSVRFFLVIFCSILM